MLLCPSDYSHLLPPVSDSSSTELQFVIKQSIMNLNIRANEILYWSDRFCQAFVAFKSRLDQKLLTMWLRITIQVASVRQVSALRIISVDILFQFILTVEKAVSSVKKKPERKRRRGCRNEETIKGMSVLAHNMCGWFHLLINLNTFNIR